MNTQQLQVIAASMQAVAAAAAGGPLVAIQVMQSKQRKGRSPSTAEEQSTEVLT
jgi:hypothetical protein